MKFSRILSSLSLVIGFASAKAIENIDNTGYTEFVETKSFKFTFNCVEDKNGICDVMKKDINLSLSYLESTFEFYQPIVFEVYVGDLEKIGIPGAAGANADTNYVPLRLSNDTSTPPYLFPQSLAKQLNIDKEPDYKSIDFVIIMDNGEFGKDEKLDDILLDILPHEITHALGFISYANVKNLSPSDQIVSFIPMEVKAKEDNDILKLVPELSPDFDKELFNAKTLDEFDNQTAMSKVSFYPLTIFEKYIVDAKTKNKLYNELGYLYRDFENCFIANNSYVNITYENYLNCYNGLSSEKKELITSLTENYLLKEQTIGFLTDNGDVIPLQTFDGKFLYGSSVSHTSYKDISFLTKGTKEYCEYMTDTLSMNEENINRFYDENFLMNYGGNNIPIDLIFKTAAKNNRHGYIGNGIVDILKTMGWTEKGESRNNNQYYLAEDVEFPEQNKFKYLLTRSSFQVDIPSEDVSEVVSEDEPEEVEEDICDIYKNNNNSDDNADSDSDFEEEQ